MIGRDDDRDDESTRCDGTTPAGPSVTVAATPIRRLRWRAVGLGGASPDLRAFRIVVPPSIAAGGVPALESK
jgi:hypothetical protein